MKAKLKKGTRINIDSSVSGIHTLDDTIFNGELTENGKHFYINEGKDSGIDGDFPGFGLSIEMIDIVNDKWRISKGNDGYSIIMNDGTSNIVMTVRTGTKFDISKTINMVANSQMLYESCGILQKRLEQLIHLTPSGKLRDDMTQENINICDILHDIDHGKPC